MSQNKLEQAIFYFKIKTFVNNSNTKFSNSMQRQNTTAIKRKPKCPHKLLKSPIKPKTQRYYTTNFDNYQTNMIQPTSTKIKQRPLKNDENQNNSNFQLCKQATLCYFGLKEVIRMQGLQKQIKKLKDQNKKLKDENMTYGEYFRQFEGRFKEQKEYIKKLKEQNMFLKMRNGKIQQISSTHSGNTSRHPPHSHKQSLTTRSTPKYTC